MKFGYFDDEQREYVITRPDTPLPWINYLGSESYFSLISNTAGGYSFYKDARLRRLTRYRYNGAPLDVGGRYIYLRDNASSEFWSPSWQPAHTDLTDYSCRHGMGYTIIGSTYSGIRAETRYFVPLGADLEIWQVTLHNRRKTAAALSLSAAVEFCLWDAWDDATNFQRNYSVGEVEIDPGVIYHKTEYRERRDHFAYFACSETPEGFDTQRSAFLGPYRGWDRPMAVEQGKMSNSIAHGWQPIGAFQIPIILQPDEQKQVIFILGYSENRKEEKFDPPDSQTINKRRVKKVIEKFLDKKTVDDAFEALRAYWREVLSVFTVTTPDARVDRMVNIWNAYQCMVTFNISRSASMFESGIGRGMGFRDSNQDLLGCVQMVPDRARQRILDLAATQLPDGGAYHQYQPLTKRGNNDIGSNFNDDPHWLVLAVSAYLRETADWTVLDERVPYDNGLDNATPLYEHLERSIQYTLDRLGPHGLPLIGRADWNDCLNLNSFSEAPGQSFQTAVSKDGKVAESVFIAGLFVISAREMAEITGRYTTKAARFGAEVHPASFYSDWAKRMAETIYEWGWDGEWFLRAYDGIGNKVGSKECEEGKIFIEPQAFCVMAGVGTENGRAEKALHSVNRLLATEHGIVLLQPAYSRYYPHLGEISSYPPGYKENGGVFCHNNPWVMIAETILGHGDRAFDYYMRINPAAREDLASLHLCEPYVYAQMLAGKEAAKPGEAKNSWLTGTAAWNYVAITQHILGIRPSFDGLEIKPCLPSDWKRFSCVRRFRGATYRIDVRRQGPGQAVSLSVNGKPVHGSVVPPSPAGKEVTVQVILQ
ncbi:MAG: glycosyl transferase [Anaerolineales bacterium]